MKTPVFHTVWYFNWDVEDFDMLGLFSVEAEAQACADEFNADNPQPDHLKKNGGDVRASVTQMTLDRVRQNLVERRLGEFHEVLVRLEKALPGAEELDLSPEGQAIVAAVKALK